MVLNLTKNKIKLSILIDPYYEDVGIMTNYYDDNFEINNFSFIKNIR